LIILTSNCCFYKQSELFQEDIFPDTAGDEPAITAEDWMNGEDADPILVSKRKPDMYQSVLIFVDHLVVAQRRLSTNKKDRIAKSES